MPQGSHAGKVSDLESVNQHNVTADPFSDDSELFSGQSSEGNRLNIGALVFTTEFDDLGPV